MRLALLLTILSFKSFATTYYVSNAGSDANDGLTPETSWETLGKINDNATAGDTVKLKCNDTWIVTNRLLPESDVYYTSYSTGAKPLITGFVTATVGSPTANVYTINVSDAAADLKTVLINGKLSIKARYPNSGYLTYSASTDSTLTTALTGTPDYTGKEIVVRAAHWILDVTKVASQSVGALSLSTKTTYAGYALGANGFFFQNHPDFLDSLNEFQFDSLTKVLKVYATSTPTVSYSTVDTLVWLRQKTNVTIDGIAFSGANKAVFQLDTCSYVTIQNCTLNNNGTNGITLKKTTNSYVLNDSILNTLNNGIMTTKNNSAPYVTDICTAITITGNYIKNTGIYAGMGLSNNNQYFGINIAADSSLISNNRVDSSGYIPIMWNGRMSTIKNNYITNYCFTKDDGGGIYSVYGSPTYYGTNGGSVVRSNIIHGGIGAVAGTYISAFLGVAAGIYLDDFADSTLVDSNTVFNTIYSSMNTRWARWITVTNNTFIDSTGNVFAGTGNQIQQSDFNLKRNIYYQKSSTNQIFTDTRWAITGTESDSNYYLRPLAPTNLINWHTVDFSYPHLFIDSTGFDLNGGTTPIGILNNYGELFYNPTDSDSTITLSNTYIDVYGTIYINDQEVVLSPFTSKLLFRYQYTFTKSADYLKF